MKKLHSLIPGLFIVLFAMFLLYPSNTFADFSKAKELYQGNGCAACHGADGEGGISQKVRDTFLLEDQFINQMRAPRGTMPAYNQTQLSDQDLKEIFKWLVSTRPASNTKFVPKDQETCLTCHNGIEEINPKKTFMTCSQCHYGNPTATTKEDAHGGEFFFPNPGRMQIVDKTCGQCHGRYGVTMDGQHDHIERVRKSLMSTEAGVISGSEWTWGTKDQRKARYSTIAVVDEDGPVPSVGSAEYKEWIAKNAADWILPKLDQVPNVSLDEIRENPNKAIYQYLRKECLRCHINVDGAARRGDYRAAGCSSCHVPYSTEGKYEGNDPTIDKEAVPKMMRHTITTQITTVSCAQCHNRGKRIGKSFTGLMESAYDTTFNEDGSGQPTLHGQRYVKVSEDIHFARGMECIDCHTSIDLHGDGNIYGTTLMAVEIQCVDCHGTINQTPWDLRGLVGNKLKTSRGNAYTNVEKRDDGKVILTSKVSGKEHVVPILKNLVDTNAFSSEMAKLSMMEIGKHQEVMECYACHASWAPQCYGCHVNLSFAEGAEQMDWISSMDNADASGKPQSVRSAGQFREGRSYLRWEDPVLGVNGKNLISPLMPGCQAIVTIIDEDGSAITANHIFTAADGLLGLAMNPANPHTTGQARTCESCHSNPKTLGYGISGGIFLNMAEEVIHDQPGSVNARKQINAVSQFPYDLSSLLSPDGKQLQTMSHWDNARPLNEQERSAIAKVGDILSNYLGGGSQEVMGSISETPKEMSMENVEGASGAKTWALIATVLIVIATLVWVLQLDAIRKKFVK